MRLSAVMISSTIPSAKYSCSGSPLILAKGSTAIEGLSGRVSTDALSIDITLRAFSTVASRDIHPVTENVVALNHDIADVDADPKLDAFLGGDFGITIGHGVLNLSR